MYSTFVAFVISLLISAILTPLIASLAINKNLVDTEGERHLHSQPIPRLGGIAVTIAFFMPLIALWVLDTSVAQVLFSHPRQLAGLAIGGCMICMLGVLDDVRGLRAGRKFLVQALVATIAFYCGFRIEAIALPLVGPIDMGVFALPITILWIVGVINALNLIDGLDGLAAGIGFFVCSVNFTIAYMNQASLVMLLSAVLAGSILGFLFYNFNPAKIFLGDSGSMFLGFIIATSSLKGASVKSSTTVALLIPIIAMGVPIMDVLLSMVRRFLERRSIFSPDNGHIHHRLLELGVTHRRAVLILYGFSMLFAFGAIAIALGRSWHVGLALAVVSIVTIGLFRSIRGFEQVQLARKQRLRTQAPSTKRLRKSVPKAIFRLQNARSTYQLFSQLEDFCREAQLQSCELWLPSDRQSPSFSWSERNGDGNRRSIRTEEYPVKAEYELGGLGGTVLRFEWSNTFGDVSLQDEILLQLIADVCELFFVHRSEEVNTYTPARMQQVL